MMNRTMIEAYLKRIGCEDAAEVSIENLARLQEGHLKHIPYENIDFVAGKGPSSLEIPDMFDRIIVKKRGGFCFELNGLLAELLRSLGYGVEEYFARWHFGCPDAIPLRRHRILKVFAEGAAFLVDAGVGCLCPLHPLKFQEDLIQPRNGRDYRIVRDSRFGFVVETAVAEGFVPYFSFTPDPHFPQDFFYVHYYCSSAPESVFCRQLMAHIYTENGRVSIEDKTSEDGGYLLRTSLPDGSVEDTPIDITDIPSVLKENFGIVIDKFERAVR